MSREGRDARHRVVIVGGGFGGLAAARAFSSDIDVTLVDRRNHHLFQPLLYQVATGGLSPANIASPLRGLLRRRRNVTTLLAEVTGFDLDARRVLLADGELAYDSLIVAAGARTHYFGRPEWERRAPPLKSLEDATRIRRQMLLAFERAERATDPAEIRALLTFVVVGGGPTGVELAGALAEIAYRILKRDFRRIETSRTRVLLVEGLDRLLNGFPEKLSADAHRGLERLGVEVRCGTLVQEVNEGEIVVGPAGAVDAGERIAAANVLWAAGVGASPLGRLLAEQTGIETDRGGRVPVTPDCSVEGRPEVFVIGDLARFEHSLEAPLPGLAPVANQQGRYVAKRIELRLRGRDMKPFRYADRGNMATVGRKMAVADIKGLTFSGFIAWLAWLFIHLMYLARFENRVLVLIQWGWNYFSRARSARLITGPAERKVETETAFDKGQRPIVNPIRR